MYEGDVEHRGEIGVLRRGEILNEIAFESVSELFDGRHHAAPKGGCYVPYGSDVRSIGAIRAFDPRVFLDFEDGDRPRWRYTMLFHDAAGADFRLAITDLAARRYLQSLHRVDG